MDKTTIVQLLHILKAEKIETTGKWVKCACLFAPWTHAHGKDGNPSFGIQAVIDGPSRFNCFTCGRAGDLMDMVMELRHLGKDSTGINFKEALDLLAQVENEEFNGLGFSDFETLMSQKNAKKPFTPFPEIFLDSFLRCPDHPYLKKRNVPRELAVLMDFRIDFHQQRIVYPVRTFDGTLAGMQGRLFKDTISDTDRRFHFYPYQGATNPSVWGNEPHLDLADPLVLCEGVYDGSTIMQALKQLTGQMNVAWSFTCQVTEEKYKRLQDASRIITFYDQGTGGDTARTKIDKYWKGKSITHLIPTEEEHDANKMGVDRVREKLEPHL